MKQDPTTIRFIHVYELLKKEGKVRSARQFALSIDTYPQSLNDILKGRRDATLQMIQKVVSNYEVCAHYLLTGEGEIRRPKSRINTAPTKSVTFIQAHQFEAFAEATQKGLCHETDWINWEIPSQMVGSDECHAFQCNSGDLSEHISLGDVLFARLVPKAAWKSNLSSKRIYIVVTQETVLFIRLQNVDISGIILRKDDRDLPVHLDFADIQEIWMPSTKLSRNLISEVTDSHIQQSELLRAIEAQSETITSIQEKLEQLSSAGALAPLY